jgi:hypothetical protein
MDPVSKSFEQYMANYTGGALHSMEFEIYDPLADFEDIDESTIVGGDHWEHVVDNDRKIDDLEHQVVESVTGEEYYKSLVVDDQTVSGGACDFRQNISGMLDQLPLK